MPGPGPPRRRARRTRRRADGQLLGRAGGDDRRAAGAHRRRRALARPAPRRRSRSCSWRPTARGAPGDGERRDDDVHRHLAAGSRGAPARPRPRVACGSCVLVVVVVYASAAATESLYPTAAARVSAAEAINGSPAIVALYGPILDVTSEGELAMTKLTVLYAVFVALLFLVAGPPPHPHRGGVRPGRAAGRHGGRPRRPAGRRRRRVGAGGARRSACWRPWRAWRRAAGHRFRGVRGLVARYRLGGDRTDRGRLPAVRQLSHVRRHRRRGARRLLRAACGRRHRSRLGLLALAVRMVDALRAWSDPRWWVLLLDVVARAAAGRPRPAPAARARPRFRAGRCAARAGRRLAAAGRRVRADLAGAPHHARVVDRRRRRDGPGDGRHRARRRRPARHRGRTAGDREHRRGGRGCRTPSSRRCSRSPR